MNRNTAQPLSAVEIDLRSEWLARVYHGRTVFLDEVYLDLIEATANDTVDPYFEQERVKPVLASLLYRGMVLISKAGDEIDGVVPWGTKSQITFRRDGELPSELSLRHLVDVLVGNTKSTHKARIEEELKTRFGGSLSAPELEQERRRITLRLGEHLEGGLEI